MSLLYIMSGNRQERQEDTRYRSAPSQSPPQGERLGCACFLNTNCHELTTNYHKGKLNFVGQMGQVSQERDSRIVTAQSMARSQLLAGKLVLSWPVLGGNLQAEVTVSGIKLFSHMADHESQSQHQRIISSV